MVSGFAAVGCEIIAIYNALRMKGKNPNIAKIALELEINGGQMGFGYLGCNPKYIANYLKAHKIKYTKYTTKKTFKNSIAKGNVYIMSYWINNYGTINIKTYKDGIHTVMVKCEKVNEFHVYNDYNEAEGVEKYNSFEELLDGFKFVCGYKIR